MTDISKTYNQIAGQNIKRIEAISDGVFAIALTLLVLDIKVPVSWAIHSETDLIHSFASLTSKLLSYFLSFMTLGIFWTAQSAQFHFIDKSDRHLNWFSLFFLLFVSIMPFTTAFLSEHISFKFALGLYWVNIFLMGLFLFINWNYAYKHHFFSISGVERTEVYKIIKTEIITAQILYGIGALLCFINTYLSISVIILIQLNFALALFTKMNPIKRRRIR